MAEEDGYGGADPSLTDEASGDATMEEQPETDPSLQEPGGGGAARAPVDLPPPPDDHADYDMVATGPIADPSPYHQPPGELPVPSVPTVPAPPTEAVPVVPPPSSEAVPLVPPPIFTPSDMPEVLPTPLSPMEAPPSAVPTPSSVAPPAAGRQPATGSLPGGQVAASSASLLPPVAPPAAVVDGGGLQGSEFQGLRQSATDAAARAVPEGEAVAVPVAAAFSAKPSTMHGRNPVNLSSRAFRLGALLVALLLVGYFVLQLFPEGDADSGTVIALAFEQGARASYDVTFTSQTSLGGDGVPTEPVKTVFNAKVDLKTTRVGGGGEGTLAVSVHDITGYVTPRPPEMAHLPDMVRDTWVVEPNGNVSSGGGTIAEAVAAETGEFAVPGWDSFFPVLATAGLEPGDTWSGTAATAFGGAGMKQETNYTYLSTKSDNAGDLAVLSVKGAVPIDITVPFGEVLARTGSSGAAGSGDANPMFTYSGRLDLAGAQWVNLDTQAVHGANLTGSYTMDVTTEGVPKDLGGDRPFSMTGSFTLSIRPSQGPVRKAASPKVEVESPSV